MAKFPVQTARAQAEIDGVIGRDRIPSWDDYSKLPYVRAYVQECVRYRPIAPIGLPHEMVQDEIIGGYLYPKNAVVFVNMCKPSLFLCYTFVSE